MAVTMTALTSGGDGTDLSSYVTASITPTTNRLVLITIQNSKGTGPATPTVTGCGLTWVQVATDTYNTIASSGKRLTVLRAMGTASTGTLTIDYAGATQTGCSWSVAEFGGTDTSGTNGSGAIVQSGTAANDGGATPPLVTLAAFGSPNNATYGAAALLGSTAMTAGSGFTQIHSVATTVPNIELQTEWRSTNDTTVDHAGGTTNDWAAAAIEINAASTSRPVSVGAGVGLNIPTTGAINFGGPGDI